MKTLRPGKEGDISEDEAESVINADERGSGESEEEEEEEEGKTDKSDAIEIKEELVDCEDVWPEDEASNFANGKDKARLFLQENQDRADLLETMML